MAQPEWAEQVDGWPKDLGLSAGTFALVERRSGRWRLRFWQRVKGSRAVRYYATPWPSGRLRAELREADQTGRWRLWSDDPRFWTPMWLHRP